MEARSNGGPAPAPLRARLLAAGADFIIVTAIGLAVDEALRVVLAEGIGFEPPPGLYPASVFVGGWFYFVFCETRFGGRTVGKMGAGLRVAGSGDALWCSVRYVAKVLQLLLGAGFCSASRCSTSAGARSTIASPARWWSSIRNPRCSVLVPPDPPDPRAGCAEPRSEPEVTTAWGTTAPLRSPLAI